jgi:mRNA-degrading endonuclease RelE of RelBE toxin-antitoxin system
LTDRTIEIKWTDTAIEALRALPRQAGRGLYRKVGALREAEDPKSVGKPLTGPLQGYYRLVHSRYRAVYGVEQAVNSGGVRVLRITILVLIVGKREAGSRRDIYELAKKLVEMTGGPEHSR